MSCNTLQDALSSELILHATDLSTLKQLLLNGADINYQSDEGWCLLFELITLGLDQHIVALKQESFDIHIKDAKSRSALFWAIFHEKPNIVETLLTLGYDTKQYVTDELPALHYAVYKNNTAIVNTLLEYQIDIECKDKYQNSALSYAYLYEREEMIRLLKQRGASSANLDYPS
jgi:ankyrin repeat protein